jgi:uridine monophosphate synthetase
MTQGFFEKLSQAVKRTGGMLCAGLDPEEKQVPERFRHEPDPLLAWNKAVIGATADVACVYKPNIAFYEALGRRGFDLLEATLAAVPSNVPVLLDAKRGDIGSTADAYARAVFEVWKADAVTVNPYLGGDTLEPFLKYADKGVFALCHTSNPGAGEFQSQPLAGRPLYQAVAEQARKWNTRGNLGLVVGATYPERLHDVRSIVPDMWLLVPGVGSQGGSLQATMANGLRRSGDGMIINVSRSLAQAPDIAAYAHNMVAEMQAAKAAGAPAAGDDSPDAVRLALALHQIGCVQFGEFTLHSGLKSPIYIDLRLLVSDPATLHLAADAYSALLRPLSYDRIAGIPYAALPIATAASLSVGKPMLYPRKEVKGYGTAKNIEGHFQAGETIVVLDDLITNGESKLTAIAPLQDAGLKVHDIVVLIDREQGGKEQLAAKGYQLHAVLGIRQLLRILRSHERITGEQEQQVLAFLEGR